ncbi:MAG: hypothetical protein J6N15_00190 [Ruminiclostridium sp.]|nr:hypothetical protein [Ruminiclostridium sp.]
MTRSMSSRVLTCSATAYARTGIDADRNPTWDGGTELGGVWITNTVRRTKGSEGYTTSDTMTLFFDADGSTPRGWQPEKGMKIAYMGGEYYIQGYTPCMSPAGLHHWEIELA